LTKKVFLFEAVYYPSIHLGELRKSTEVLERIAGNPTEIRTG